MKASTPHFFSFFLSISLLSIICCNNGAVEDTSGSGAAAASVGGALAGSDASGTTAMNLFQLISTAHAANASCPTLKTADGSGCSIVDAKTVDLTYSTCSFGKSAATWDGVLQIADNSGVVCGTFPKTTLTRQFVTSTSDNTPSTGQRTSAKGTVVTIDHKTTDLSNYQGDTIAPTIGTGYGDKVTWVAGARTKVDINQRVSSPQKFDHSIVGSLNVTETPVTAIRTVTGSILVYHNLLKVEGTSTFNSVVYENVCCVPIGGSITTTFAATSHSGVAGNALDGKSETLTFTGCGTGTLTGADGKTIDVDLDHCL